jgi:hypothetical protein
MDIPLSIIQLLGVPSMEPSEQFSTMNEEDKKKRRKKKKKRGERKRKISPPSLDLRSAPAYISPS